MKEYIGLSVNEGETYTVMGFAKGVEFLDSEGNVIDKVNFDKKKNTVQAPSNATCIRPLVQMKSYQMINQEQINGIEDGIIEGFHQQGISLSARDKWMINLTIKTTVSSVEKVLNADSVE